MADDNQTANKLASTPAPTANTAPTAGIRQQALVQAEQLLTKMAELQRQLDADEADYKAKRVAKESALRQVQADYNAAIAPLKDLPGLTVYQNQ